MAALLDSIQNEPAPAETGAEVVEPEQFEGFLLQKIREGDAKEILEAFENTEHPVHSEMQNEMKTFDTEGKSPVDLAACLGRKEILEELHKRGASLNEATETGYTPLHRAAAWNRLACVKYLVQNDANINALTVNKERPKDIAERYRNNECRWYLEWAEVKQDLIRFLKDMRDTVMEPDRILGRLTKDDKNQTLAVCQEKIDWAENAHDVTSEEIREKRREIENFLEHVIHKLNEPPADKGQRK